MASWRRAADGLRRREEAATLVEYTLAMVLIAAACFAAVSSFGSAVAGLFVRAVNSVPR